MKSSNKVVILLSFLLLTIVILIIVLATMSPESDQDLYIRSVNDVEVVTNKLTETDFQQKLITKLKDEGYKPTGSIGYTIFSMEKKQMTIVLHGIDSNRSKAENYIQELTNQLSSSIGLGTFEVTILENND